MSERYDEGEYRGLSRGEAALARLMSYVSETCYCAGWDSDTEHGVWRMATEGGSWGMGQAESLPELDVILAHARSIDRWITWAWETGDTDDSPSYLALPLDEWQAVYAVERARRDAAAVEREARQAACPHLRRSSFLPRCSDCYAELPVAPRSGDTIPQEGASE